MFYALLILYAISKANVLGGLFDTGEVKGTVKIAYSLFNACLLNVRKTYAIRYFKKKDKLHLLMLL